MHDIAYSIDPAGFKNRINTLLDISSKYGIRPTLLFFTDAPIENPTAGKQPKPIPGIASACRFLHYKCTQLFWTYCNRPSFVVPYLF
jgi:hypothetical protein